MPRQPQLNPDAKPFEPSQSLQNDVAFAVIAKAANAAINAWQESANAAFATAQQDAVEALLHNNVAAIINV